MKLNEKNSLDLETLIEENEKKQKEREELIKKLLQESEESKAKIEEMKKQLEEEKEKENLTKEKGEFSKEELIKYLDIYSIPYEWKENEELLMIYPLNEEERKEHEISHFMIYDPTKNMIQVTRSYKSPLNLKSTDLKTYQIKDDDLTVDKVITTAIAMQIEPNEYQEVTKVWRDLSLSFPVSEKDKEEIFEYNKKILQEHQDKVKPEIREKVERFFDENLQGHVQTIDNVSPKQKTIAGFAHLMSELNELKLPEESKKRYEELKKTSRDEIEKNWDGFKEKAGKFLDSISRGLGEIERAIEAEIERSQINKDLKTNEKMLKNLNKNYKKAFEKLNEEKVQCHRIIDTIERSNVAVEIFKEKVEKYIEFISDMPKQPTHDWIEERDKKFSDIKKYCYANTFAFFNHDENKTDLEKIDWKAVQETLQRNEKRLAEVKAQTEENERQMKELKNQYKEVKDGFARIKEEVAEHLSSDLRDWSKKTRRRMRAYEKLFDRVGDGKEKTVQDICSEYEKTMERINRRAAEKVEEQHKR